MHKKEPNNQVGAGTGKKHVKKEEIKELSTQTTLVDAKKCIGLTESPNRIQLLGVFQNIGRMNTTQTPNSEVMINHFLQLMENRLFSAFCEVSDAPSQHYAAQLEKNGIDFCYVQQKQLKDNQKDAPYGILLLYRAGLQVKQDKTFSLHGRSGLFEIRIGKVVVHLMVVHLPRKKELNNVDLTTIRNKSSKLKCLVVVGDMNRMRRKKHGSRFIEDVEMKDFNRLIPFVNDSMVGTTTHEKKTHAIDHVAVRNQTRKQIDRTAQVLTDRAVWVDPIIANHYPIQMGFVIHK